MLLNFSREKRMQQSVDSDRFSREEPSLEAELRSNRDFQTSEREPQAVRERSVQT